MKVLVKAEGWQSSRNTLLEMYERLNAQGIPLVVVVFPYAHQLKLEANDNLIQNDLLTFCQNHDIACLDLFPCYQANSQSIRWEAEGIHPDEGGHQIACEAIFNSLNEQQLIPIQNNVEVRYE